MTSIHSLFCKGAALALSAACVLSAQPGPGRGGRMGFGMGHGGGLGTGAFLNHTVTGAPFSAKLSIQHAQTLANGNQIQRQEQANVYRDGQGRVRVESTVNQTENQITIYDPVAGYIYRLNPQNMTGVQMPLPPNRPERGTRTPPANPDVQTQNLGTQTINGVSATGTQITRTIAAGQIGNTQPIQMVRVTWISTALQVPVQITVTDPRSGNTAMNLTGIVQSEPAGSFFVVPSGYTVTSAPGRGGPRRR